MRQAGVLSQLQDAGRFGHHGIGLTNGGPIDAVAMTLVNRLLDNPAGACCIESSFGGLELEANTSTVLAFGGGDIPLSINGVEQSPWRSYRVHPGDRIKLGFAQQFCRGYLAVAGGFQVEPEFDSQSTVIRECVGGTHGDKLGTGEILPCLASQQPLQQLRDSDLPRYSNEIVVRVIPGYQCAHFSKLEQRRFFSSTFEVSDRADRMGYRLTGPTIRCDIEGILSEGICHAAIQVPADGQPIVLMNDRQTIGGYPKIGSALSLDLHRLGQLTPGATVRFEKIDLQRAHNLLHLHRASLATVQTEFIDD